MNKTILNQLKSLTSTTVEFDEKDTSIFIPKTVKILSSALRVGSIYIIQLHTNITNPPPQSVLASNWNNGVVPKYEKYIVEVNDNMGKMVKVTGVAVENNTSQFIGWLPYDGFDVLSKFT